MTDKKTADYRRDEIFSACPLPLLGAAPEKGYPFGIDIQIRTEHGATKWLKITPAEMSAVETLLTGE